VADHAVRAMSSFPQAVSPYYGVDYQNRPDSNDLSWYRNIPVPTSYMVCKTQSDFFGGYDFKTGGGFVHVANRHVAPGKKQWTWGNHGFGWAWDRELTDSNGPYVELMAGVYTDNQPDFSYLAPYETKTFSQYWWPIQGIGPVQQATGQVALRMVVREDRVIDLGVCVSQAVRNARLVVMRGVEVLLEKTFSLVPGKCWKHAEVKFTGENPAELMVTVFDEEGERLLGYRPVEEGSIVRDRELATEPPAPEDMTSTDELYFTGEHLELYRHPTRSPELYWNEALRRDSGDARCNLGMGRRALRQGRLDDAARHFWAAIARLTRRHPNPETGEGHYFLGLTLVFKGAWDEAYAMLYKATWNQAWRAPAFYQIACLDCRKYDYDKALEHLEEALATNSDHTKAMVLQAVIARHTEDSEAAADLLQDVLALDPLDHWARYEGTFCGLVSKGDFLGASRNDAQTILDLAFEYSDAGFTDDAAKLIERHLAQPVVPVAVPNPSSRTPMCQYVLAWLKNDMKQLAAARKQPADYFFPSRMHEQQVLEWAIDQPGGDPVAGYALGNHYYDLRRHEDAIRVWKRAVDDSADFATVFRNLGIAVWNVRRDGEGARSYYLQALALDPGDPRLVSEYDQLRAKLNDPVADRLRFLEDHLELVLLRDDCTVALATLHNLSGYPEKALEILTSRRFHPWEGGEGSVLRQFTNAHLLLGRRALAAGGPATALAHFSGAMETPASLGEAYHLLQAKADVNYWIGMALKLLGRVEEAEAHFSACAGEDGDFSDMAVIAHSPLSYYRGLALRELGRGEEANAVLEGLKSYARQKLGETARIDYFATSLPNLLVFDEDLQAQRDSEFHLLVALACHGLGDAEGARSALAKTLAFTNANQRAADLAAELAHQIDS
jgi:tetratricopeptide (TPR) repeat protein